MTMGTSLSAPATSRGGLGASPETTEPLVDGRAARGERTRRALAEAMIALLEEGDDSPTARRIAERAGVSLRLVFHHFEDVESVLKAAVAVQAERHWRRIQPVATSLELSRRVRRVVRQRAELYEAIAPVRRAAASLERTSPTISKELARGGALLREQLHEAFEPELSGLSRPGARRVLDALETATSFDAWDGLRRMGRSGPEASRVLELLMERCLSSKTHSGGSTRTKERRRQ
jgi:TetR/AcrR family transcriptional regulator, regulator of autoinduction and epiphytic fitness